MINKTPALALCLLALCLATMGQERATRQLIVPLADGGFVAFKSETAWADTKRASASAQELRGEFGSQALVDENHVVHRVLMDGSGKLIFGYDLFIAPNAVLKKFKIAVNPLDAQFADKLRARDSDRSEIRISTLPQSAAPQTLDDGDAFALDLLVNQNTGVKIVDIVKVSFDRARLWDTNPKTLPRDFTLEAVELAVKDYRLVINGSVAATGKRESNFAGALIWFCVEGQGRFIFSLLPREGYQFQKVGVVEDNRIEFTVNGQHYEWLSGAPILRGGGTWNLWVLHDPKYAPFGPDETARKEGNKWDKLDASIKAAQDRAAKVGDPTPSTFHKNTGGAQNEPSVRRPRVMVGSADRIENLWPKQ